VEVRYKDHFVGWGYADIIVRCGANPNVLLELKRNKKISKADVQQARNYMKQLKIENGFVINFGSNGNTDVDEDPKKSKALEVAVKEVSLND
jgi:GxxExxY protein